MSPTVSIVILNRNHPEVIEVCLRTLQITEGVGYETVVVDNGSDAETVQFLRDCRSANWLTTLVESPENLLFSGGNNLGVANADPASEYILLLNSDVGFLRGDWLEKVVGWMEGTTEYRPTIWASAPATPDPGPRDILSVGWSHDANVEPSHARPEGWCCMFRRPWWRDLSLDFPWHGGFEKSVAESIRAGAKCGVLFNYAPFLIHREGGSGKLTDVEIVNHGSPDFGAWFGGLRVETLDFRLGPDEHSSYLDWS